jgi:membrane protease subunit HflK
MEIANADAQARDFDKVYQAYRLSPQVTRTRMYYDMMEAVLGKSGKTIVDAPNANVTLPSLAPRRDPTPSSAPAPAAPQASAAPSAPAASAQPGDGQ